VNRVILASYLNAEPDPQRHTMLPADPSGFQVLRESVARAGEHLVIFTDGLKEPNDDHLTYVRVPASGENPYWRRWGLFASWLANHPWVEQAWCVDATDTELLNDPWDMEPGRLHVGSEPWTFGSERLHDWTATVAPSMLPWIDEHPDDVVINCGTVGGDATLVRDMAFMLNAAENTDPADMGVWWAIMYDHFPNWVTGHPVHTVFNSWDDDPAGGAWWRHK
jgi:hypothetical protein